MTSVLEGDSWKFIFNKVIHTEKHGKRNKWNNFSKKKGTKHAKVSPVVRLLKNSISHQGPNLKNLSGGLNLSRGQIVSIVSRFKPALNLNRVLADLNRGSNSLNSIPGRSDMIWRKLVSNHPDDNLEHGEFITLMITRNTVSLSPWW